MARAVLREEGFPEGLVGWLRKCGDQLQDFRAVGFFGRSINVVSAAWYRSAVCQKEKEISTVGPETSLSPWIHASCIPQVAGR